MRESGINSKLRTPAVRALLIQCISLLIVVVLLAIIWRFSNFQISIFQAALLQGVVAACLSWWRRRAAWWHFIQFLFPVALVLTLSLHLPPVIFLGLFFFLLALYWSTFRTQVPYYPSGRQTWEAVAQLLPQNRVIHFVDIGSGFGGAVMHLAALRPDSQFIGIEVAPMPWLVSWLRAHVQRSRARFKWGDYSNLNFADFDVVFAYLSPVAMPALFEKVRAEMRPDALFLSYEFPIPDQSPDITIYPTQRNVALFGWRL